MFDRIYGRRYFSSKALIRSIQLSMIPIIIFIILVVVFGQKFWMLLSWETALFAFLPRICLNIAVDFINIARSRYILQHLKNAQKFARASMIYLAIDVLCAMTLSIVFNIIAMNVFSILYTSYLTREIQLNLQLNFLNLTNEAARLFVWEYFYSLFAFREKEAVFVYLSILPSLLIYILVAGVAISKLGAWLKWPFSHIRFRKPFSFVFTISGTGIATILMIVGASWI
jgi:hypothetical protein